jgi:hypothetical protein
MEALREKSESLLHTSKLRVAQASGRGAFRAGTLATPSSVFTSGPDSAWIASRAMTSRSIDSHNRSTTRPGGTPH